MRFLISAGAVVCFVVFVQANGFKHVWALSVGILLVATAEAMRRSHTTEDGRDE